MRPWWIDKIKSFSSKDGPYSIVLIHKPSPIFEDKTIDYNKFLCDCQSDRICDLVNAMNNENIINANVLCPWSCSASCTIGYYHIMNTIKNNSTFIH